MDFIPCLKSMANVLFFEDFEQKTISQEINWMEVAMASSHRY